MMGLIGGGHIRLIRHDGGGHNRHNRLIRHDREVGLIGIIGSLGIIRG